MDKGMIIVCAGIACLALTVILAIIYLIMGKIGKDKMKRKLQERY